MSQPIPPEHFDLVMKLAKAAAATGDVACRQRAKALRLGLVKAERLAARRCDDAARRALADQARCLAEATGAVVVPARAVRQAGGIDPVKALVASGALDRVHDDAAGEIRDVADAWDRAMGAHGSSYGDRTAGSGHYVQPIERLDGELLNALQHRYDPWKRWADGRPALAERAQGPRVTLLRLTLGVVVWGHGTTAYDRLFGVGNGTCAVRLRRALDEYCYIAGWLPRPRPERAEALPDHHARALALFRRRLERDDRAMARALATLGLGLGDMKAARPGEAMAKVRETIAGLGDGVRTERVEENGVEIERQVPWPAAERRRHVAGVIFGTAFARMLTEET